MPLITPDFSVAVADADQYRLSFAGVNVSLGAGQSGYADGEFFNCAPKSDGYITVVGTDGAVARSKTNNRLLEFSIILLQTSPTNDFFSAVFAADENNPNGAGIGSFTLQDLQGTTLIACLKSWIIKPSDVVLDRGAKERKWSFNGVRSIYNVGSN